MPLVIATKRLYLLCDDITSIKVERVEDEIVRKSKAPKAAKKENAAPAVDNRMFQLEITYNFGPHDCRCVFLQVVGEQNALDTFREIVQEIRDQKPDNHYMDKLMEKLLT